MNRQTFGTLGSSRCSFVSLSHFILRTPPPQNLRSIDPVGTQNGTVGQSRDTNAMLRQPHERESTDPVTSRDVLVLLTALPTWASLRGALAMR